MIKPTIWVVVLVLLSVTKLVLAAPPRGGSVVLLAEGTGVDAERELSDFVPSGVNLQTPEELKAAVASQGITGSIGEALQNPRTRKQSLLAVRDALRDVGASAVLVVQLNRGRAGTRDMHVILLIASQTEPMLEEDITLARRERATARLTPLVSASLQDLAPPPRRRRTTDAVDATPTSAPEAEPPPPPARKAPAVDKERPSDRASRRARRRKEHLEDEPEPAEEADEAPPSAPQKDAVAKKREKLHHNNAMVVADAGIGFGSRRLEYSDPVAGPLREYMAPAMVTFSLGAEIYPGASSGMTVLKDIGLVGRFTSSLPVASKVEDGGEPIQGRFQRYAVGVRGRIRIGDQKDSPLVGVEGTYGVWSFDFGANPVVTDALLPVAYKHVRAGVDGRVPFGSFSLLGALGYMNISSAGLYSQQFPNATIAGVDAMVGGGYAVASFINLRATLTYARIFSSANPELDAPYVAGGALDQYFIASLGASAIF